jgi:hypothetical protein
MNTVFLILYHKYKGIFRKRKWKFPICIDMQGKEKYTNRENNTRKGRYKVRCGINLIFRRELMMNKMRNLENWISLPILPSIRIV